MFQSIIRLLAISFIILAGTFFAASTASSQDCVVINGIKIVTTPTTVIVYGINGGYKLSWAVGIPQTGPLDENLMVDYLDVNGGGGILGNITLSSDPTRPHSASTIISNFPPNRFPATGIIRFYATATFDSQSGVIYTSLQELELENTNLNQIFPFGNATFTLKNNVVFTAPGAPSIILTAGVSHIVLP